MLKATYTFTLREFILICCGLYLMAQDHSLRDEALALYEHLVFTAPRFKEES